MPKDSSIGKSLTTTSCNNRGWSQKSSSSHMSIREKFLDKYIQIKLNEISLIGRGYILCNCCYNRQAFSIRTWLVLHYMPLMSSGC
ncbi:hypothetical protein RYX36_004636 [Vicia faba]